MIYFNQETKQFSSVESREFGFKSKALGFLAPSAWHGKETAKYMYDTEDEYKEHRGKEALKGLFTPISTARRHERAKTMYEMGASPKQIREALERRNLRTAGAGGILVGLHPHASHGLVDAFDPYRKKFDK